MKDWIKRKEREFTKRINNFKLLVKTIKEAYEKGRLVLYNPDGFSLMLKIYYTIIFKEENISFELHKKSEDEEENKRLIGEFYSGSDSVVGKLILDLKQTLLDIRKNLKNIKKQVLSKLELKILEHVLGIEN